MVITLLALTCDSVLCLVLYTKVMLKPDAYIFIKIEITHKHIFLCTEYVIFWFVSGFIRSTFVISDCSNKQSRCEMVNFKSFWRCWSDKALTKIQILIFIVHPVWNKCLNLCTFYNKALIWRIWSLLLIVNCTHDSLGSLWWQHPAVQSVQKRWFLCRVNQRLQVLERVESVFGFWEVK